MKIYYYNNPFSTYDTTQVSIWFSYLLITNLFSITRSDQGSVTKLGNEIVFQEATQIEQIVDTTGAGDAYTAGFLFGWTSGKPLQECAKIGNQCAASVIQQIGGRLEPGFVID